MSTVTPSYGTLTTIVLTALSLGSDAALSSGRQSTVIDNSTVCGVDLQIQGYFTLGTGLATTTKQVEIWFFGSNDGTNYSGGATSGDAALNVCGGNKVLMKLVDAIPTENTATKTKKAGPYSMAAAFGGNVPKYSGMFIVQNTCGSLFSTSGTHEFTYQPIFYASN